MRSEVRKWKPTILACAIVAIVLANLTFAAAATKTRRFADGEKVSVSGPILSRDGDLVRIRDKNSDGLILIRINDSTKIERSKHKFPFYRHTDMDVTALLPGLNIEAEGVGNSDGQLDAGKISFTPDDFAIEVAEEQQVLANKASTRNAQAAADRAADVAGQAQSSADQAENSADQASGEAQAAGVLGVADAAAVVNVNGRLSDLDTYKNEFEVAVFFPEGSAVLDSSAKRDLSNLADIAKSLEGYMIEVSGYAAHQQLSLEEDQKLSEERASAVARYFLEAKNIPMRRILVPVGYGATHPVASNQDRHGRDLNRYVDVKVLVNKGLGQGM
jgi:outer membrane protein OmpA-like peptidoglycan-associated protein